MNPSEIAAQINELHRGTFAEHLGIAIIEASRESVRAKVTLDGRHLQPMGIVHGGVYASVIESLASVGASIDAMSKGKHVVGLENHTSFVRAFRGGALDALATPLTRGGRSQLWEVALRNEQGELIARGTVRLLVLEADADVRGAKLSMRTE